MKDTKQEDKPEVDVVFPSLVRFDSETLLLIGGMRGEEQRASLAKGASRGFTVQQGKIDPASENKHLYSLRTGKWRFIGHGKNDPCGWELHAHNIDEKKVLVLSGQPNYALTNTYMYIVSEKADGSVEWSKVDESSNGMPPSTAVFRGSTWIASANSLFLYGGRYNYINIHDSVFKQRNSDHDTTMVYYMIQKCTASIWNSSCGSDCESRQVTILETAIQ
ncbi:predicted protein [Chaetoceros tenuissimus]|uniref:Uncharacterized protein n=1 Tax=Chaetoceros tenuissimus TaxID=426638 RepID=A0AAD3H9Z9_9STRA|nr:predicted protein [Chaetoceros tenuissimus]